MPHFSDIRPLLAPWGKLQPQSPNDWKGPYPLPEMIITFYQEIGPWGDIYYESVGPVGLTINVGGNPVEIPPLHKLWAQQDGYAWSRNPENKLNDWPTHWLVIAREGSLPFIFDRNDGSIFFHYTGMGNWNSPHYFAPDLPTALGAIATHANALVQLGEDALDETYALKSSSTDYIEEKLATFLGSKQQARDMLIAWERYD